MGSARHSEGTAISVEVSELTEPPAFPERRVVHLILALELNTPRTATRSEPRVEAPWAARAILDF